LNAASRICAVLENSDASFAINRNSGRIIAVNKGFCAITGIAEKDAVSQEYRELNNSILNCFSGKKLRFENFNADEVYISLVSIVPAGPHAQTAVQSLTHGTSTSHDAYRFVDEAGAVGLYLERFNSLLESNLQSALPNETLAQIEKIVSELANISSNKSASPAGEFDFTGQIANLHLLIQSNLMSHRAFSNKSSQTFISIGAKNGINLQIRFETPVEEFVFGTQVTDEWRKLAEKLAEQFGLNITELKVLENKIVNSIQITNEKANENARKS
ncbi:MAG: PAS domain-containing protein, partial [Candidatus Zixiibacteriota bacterium]